VLYVGDWEGRALFTRIAKRWDGVTLIFAVEGGEGLDMAVKRRPRMVVLDARLPDMDGEKLVMALRERAMPPSAPIVVLSHDGAPSERARFIWAGASAYLTKPLNVAEIDRTVGELLQVAGLL
jgi:DNA-binding response OmpR family regulator